jgi:hypothetical protein
MKKLTGSERITAGKLWDAGYGINAIATVIDDKRRDMDMHYLAEQVAEEMVDRVGITGEGTDD